jgi:hypothetical protein
MMFPEWKRGSTVGFGMLWGLAWGLVFLAPAIVRTHNMAGTHVQAMAFIALMAAVFALLGAGISIGLFAIQWVARRILPAKYASRIPAASIAAGVLVPAVYLAVGSAIYFLKFRTIGGAGWYQRAALNAVIATVAAALIAVIYVRITSRMSLRKRDVVLAVAGAAIVVVAAATLVFRFPPLDRRVTNAYALERSAEGSREKRKLLVIGIDGGTWHVISPLLEKRQLPTFDALMRSGVHGNVAALWPPYWSVAAWAAIITGHRRRDIGVFGDLQVTVAGLPPFQSPMDLEPQQLPLTALEYVLASRRMIRVEVPGRKSLRLPPVWELLDRSGIETAVIRFNFTHPATGQAAFVVSNRAMSDIWRQVGVHEADRRELAEPASRADELLAPFSREWAWDSSALDKVLRDRSWPKPADATVDPVRTLRGALRFDDATAIAASRLMQSDPSIEVMFVHFGGVDTIEHTFWQYRFPNEFKNKPAQADVVALGSVIDRYMEFVDSGIAKIIASFPEAPNVLIVSDHGQAAREDGVPFKGWHASPGIFLAAGPDIAHRAEQLDVSYFDIVPTILELKGFTRPRDLRGRPLLEKVN